MTIILNYFPCFSFCNGLAFCEGKNNERNDAMVTIEDPKLPV